MPCIALSFSPPFSEPVQVRFVNPTDPLRAVTDAFAEPERTSRVCRLRRPDALITTDDEAGSQHDRKQAGSTAGGNASSHACANGTLLIT